MKKIGLLLVSAALLAGCASTPATPPSVPATVTPAAKPSLPTLTSAQISALADKLRAVDPAAVQGSFDKAQAMCLQLADGAHGEGFLKGVATRFGTDPAKGQALVDAVKSAGVCG